MSDIDLWELILGEARDAAGADLAYGATLRRAILDRSGIGQAMTYQIATRLGRPFGVEQEFEAAARQAFAADATLTDAAFRDLQGIVSRDPATPGLLPVLLHFKGYLAVQAWRVSHWLWRERREDLALLLQNASSSLLQVSIHPSAELGISVFLDHGTGIVIGPYARIGDDVTILQNVTVGRRSDAADKAPRIGRGVLLSSEALIIGDVSIGDFAKVGAGAVVDRDVPAGCTAVGVPARLTNCPDKFAA
jgi:serine O-acetyltransferase